MSAHQQKEEHAALVDAAGLAERHNYAVGLAAVAKSLTSAEKPTAEETAVIKAAEEAWQRASKALTDYEARH